MSRAKIKKFFDPSGSTSTQLLKELLYLLHATACKNNKREREKHAAPWRSCTPCL